MYADVSFRRDTMHFELRIRKTRCETSSKLPIGVPHMIERARATVGPGTSNGL